MADTILHGSLGERKARPILMSAPMVLACLREDDPKSQTRRIFKQAAGLSLSVDFNDGVAELSWLYGDGPGHEVHEDIKRIACPYGKPGDLLWVRETCCAHEVTDKEAESNAWNLMDRLDWEKPCYGLDGVLFKADNHFEPIHNTRQAAEAWGDLNAYRGARGATVPPIHMPRWASRLTLRITEVRVERLQDITTEDAKAEGVETEDYFDRQEYFDNVLAGCEATGRPNPRSEYEALWEKINGEGSWGANPYVWVICFEVIRKNVDEVLRG